MNMLLLSFLTLLCSVVDVDARTKHSASHDLREEAELAGKFSALKGMGDNPKALKQLRSLRYDVGKFPSLRQQVDSYISTIDGRSALHNDEAVSAAPMATKSTSHSVESIRPADEASFLAYAKHVIHDASGFYTDQAAAVERDRIKLIEERANIQFSSGKVSVDWYNDAVVVHKKVAELIRTQATKEVMGAFKVITTKSDDISFSFEELNQAEQRLIVPEFLWHVFSFLTDNRLEDDAYPTVATDTPEAINYGEMKDVISEPHNSYFTQELYVLPINKLCQKMSECSFSSFRDTDGNYVDAHDSMFIELLIVIGAYRFQQSLIAQEKAAAIQAEYTEVVTELADAVQSGPVSISVDEDRLDDSEYILNTVIGGRIQKVKAFKPKDEDEQSQFEAHEADVKKAVARFLEIDAKLRVLHKVRAGIGRKQAITEENIASEQHPGIFDTQTTTKMSTGGKIAAALGTVLGIAILASTAVGAYDKHIGKKVTDSGSMSRHVGDTLGAAPGVGGYIKTAFETLAGLGGTAYDSAKGISLPPLNLSGMMKAVGSLAEQMMSLFRT